MFAVAHPKGMLSQWVECIWLYDARGEDRGPEVVLPTGTVEVVFDLSGEGMPISSPNTRQGVTFHELVVCGPHNRPFTLHNGPNDCVFGIHLKPAGAARFLSVSACHLTNRHTNL